MNDNQHAAAEVSTEIAGAVCVAVGLNRLQSVGDLARAGCCKVAQIALNDATLTSITPAFTLFCIVSRIVYPAGLRDANLSPDRKCGSFQKIPNVLQDITTSTYFGRVKMEGKIFRERQKT